MPTYEELYQLVIDLYNELHNICEVNIAMCDDIIEDSADTIE